MKKFGNVSLSTLLFSALLGALAVIIYRWLRKPPAPSRPAKSPPLRIRQVSDPEPCSYAQRRLKPNMVQKVEPGQVHHRQFATWAEARAAIFEWIEVFYNPERFHSALGFKSPVDFETQLN